MKTTNPAPLETPIQPPKNEEPSSSASSSSSASTHEPPTDIASPLPTSNRPTGRPSKLTPHLISAICHQITEFGHSDSAAAAHFGIPASTLSRWKFLNPDMELRFASSREDFRSRQIYKIENATTKDGRHDWRASAWLLERIFPQDYARRPGRRVNPASEEQTWLEESCAAAAEKQERKFRFAFESARDQGEAAAREYLSKPAWDLVEPNANAPLPVTASFDAKHQGPASLPSYATYAEALEQALHFDARKASMEFPLPTPKPAPAATSETSKTPASAPPESASRLYSGPSRNDGVSPSCDHSGEAAISRAPISEITETLENTETRVAEGHTHASPWPASITSAATGSVPTTSRPEGTAQEDARSTETNSEITESVPRLGESVAAVAPIEPLRPQLPTPVFPVLTAFPFLPLSKTNGTSHSQTPRAERSETDRGRQAGSNLTEPVLPA
jgi:hypothetical protein